MSGIRGALTRKIKTVVPQKLRDWAEEFTPFTDGRAATTTRTTLAESAPAAVPSARPRAGGRTDAPPAFQAAPSQPPAPAQPAPAPSAPRSLALKRQLDAVELEAVQRCADVAALRDDLVTLHASLAANQAFGPPAEQSPDQREDADDPAAPTLAETRAAAFEALVTEKALYDRLVADLARRHQDIVGNDPGSDIFARIAQLAADAAQAKSAAAPAEISALSDIEQDLATVATETRARSAEFDARKTDLGAALAQLWSARVAEFQTRDADPAEAAFAPLRDGAKDLIERAATRLAEDSRKEREAFAKTGTIATARKLATYDFARVIDAKLAGELLAATGSPSGQALAAACDAMKHDVEAAFATSGFNDLVVDLMTRTTGEFSAAIAARIGLPDDRQSWTAEQARAVDSLAEALKAQTIAACPNKLAADRSAVTCGGKTYAKDMELRGGSENYVARYGDADNGIVTKSPYEAMGTAYRDERQADLVKEINNYLATMGPAGETHPNVVTPISLAVDDEGVICMILPECKGGSGDHFASSMQAAIASGALPKSAQEVLTRAMFNDAARGLKHIADSGLTHNDVKAGNILIAEDGTAMIADLGSVGEVDSQGIAANPGANSPAFSNPKETLSQKHDVFMLGTFLNNLRGAKTPAEWRKRPDNQIMALNRLRTVMLDPDPANRPTMEMVMLSAYVDDARQDDLSPAAGSSAVSPNIAALKKAVGKLSVIQSEIHRSGKELEEARQALRAPPPGPGADPRQTAAYAAMARAKTAVIASCEAAIANAESRTDAALADIASASQEV